MNLILLYPHDFISAHQVTLTDRRLNHIRQIHNAKPGDSLKVGLLDGSIGTGTITTLSDTQVTLDTHLHLPPPPPLPLTLVLALPRPKMFRRILQSVAALGVKELIILNSYRVDKSYWSTPWLENSKITEQFLLGLEQAVDTRLPRITLKKRFKPFVEDELPALASGQRALIAHPYEALPCPAPELTPTLLAIGPEGGFIPYEVAKLQEAGLTSIHIGQRILRVETAIPALLSRLFPLL